MTNISSRGYISNSWKRSRAVKFIRGVDVSLGSMTERNVRDREEEIGKGG